MVEPPADEAAPQPSILDGRSIGDWKSRYAPTAWFHILGELFYLLVLLFGVSLTLVGIGKAILNSQFAADGWLACCFSLPDGKPILVWVVAALSGVCGGATFSLK
jgi:hypothetical protein